MQNFGSIVKQKENKANVYVVVVHERHEISAESIVLPIVEFSKPRT